MAALNLPLTGSAGVFVVLFGVVLVMPRLAERLRLPGVVGLTAGGLIIGPTGIGLVERAGTVALLGGAGLLFLMFEAGLETDRDVLNEERRETIFFGVATFVAPFALGFAVHIWLGFSLLAALLLASCWSSHTLLSYPLFQRAGVTDSRAVAVGLGGTVITDTAALLVLVAIARLYEGDLSWGYGLALVPILAGAGVAILWALPRAATWFFTGIGQERSARFLFVMVALFGAAGVAQVAGVEPIIGAFLAGFALNRLVVPGSVLAAQVSFFGSNLMTPMFMISVGMLIDPGLLISDVETLERAIGFTLAVVGGKATAAYVTGRVFRWRRAEIAALFSLSVAQAAATLAAVFVGVEIGLLGPSTVNAVILVVLVTCVLSSLVGDVVTTRLPPRPARVERLGRRVVLATSHPSQVDATVRVSAALASADTGIVVPVAVLGLRATSAQVGEHRKLMVAGVERAVLGLGADGRSEVRLDASTSAGVLHAAVEQDATCITVGWKGWSTRRETFFGRNIDLLMQEATVPVLVVRPGINVAPQRVVVAIDEPDLRLDMLPGIVLAAAAAARLGAAHKVAVEVCSVSALDPGTLGLPASTAVQVVESETALMETLGDLTASGDIVVKGLATTRLGLGNRFVRFARSLPGRTVVAVSPPRSDPMAPLATVRDE